jgi:hypothetical protein
VGPVRFAARHRSSAADLEKVHLGGTAHKGLWAIGTNVMGAASLVPATVRILDTKMCVQMP